MRNTAITLCFVVSIIPEAINGGEVKFINSIDGFSYAIDVFVVEDYVYLIDQDFGLIILSLDNMNEMHVVSRFSIDDECERVFVSNEFAYVSFGGVLSKDETGMQIIDVSNPTRPKSSGRFETPDILRGLYVKDNYAYLAVSHKGLQIVDVSNPDKPTLAGSSPTTDWLWDVCVSGDYAYLACFYAGLLIFDISNREMPTFISSYDTQAAQSVDVQGNYAYVADGSNGLYTLDVSDPTQLKLVSLYKKPKEPDDLYDFQFEDVKILGQYAYAVVARTEGRVQVINISVPEKPVFSAEFGPFSFFLDNIFIAGQYIFVPETSRLVMLKFQE